ncbi:MAG TPA: GntR family transcriptional regulator, partial [Arenibaculum sp.]|nr:GntR family transcriptional regulator [Arenibaculum sp.]
MSNWLPDIGKFPGPRYLALVNAIGNAIAEGSLSPGSRLPPRRELAYRLGLSVNTVGSAYLEAERRGWVVGEVGRGTYVLATKVEPDAGYFMESRPSDVIDLSICRPCVDPEQVAPVCGALERMAQGPDFSWLLSCRPVIGLDIHRRAGAEWLNRIGVPAGHERIILTNGCSHGLLVVLATLTEPGNAVLTEALADHGLISLANVLHLELRGLAADEYGILPDAFEAGCRAGNVKVLVTTPTL